VKRVVLTVGVAALVLGLISCNTDPPDLSHIENVPSLSVIWADYFPMGNIVAFQHHRRPGDIGNSMRWALLTRHFDILTAEDEMKPDHIQASQGSFSWGRGERIVSATTGAGMRVHGHALAWHSQTPTWMFAGGDREQAIRNLETHIDRVMRRWPTIESWDVLNEIFASGVGSGSGPLPVTADNWRQHLRGNNAGTSGWFNSIGSDPNGYCFIWIAFTTARRVADDMGRSDMILYYNDYNEEQPNKRDAIYFMVREMNERFARENNGRRLIDAIGMQAHYHRGNIPGDPPARFPWGPVNVNNVRAAIERFASLDVYVSITELDITVGHTGSGPLTATQEREQALLYARLFQIFKELADREENPIRLRRVTFWGIDDPSSWRHEGSPHLWDRNLRPKEAFWAVADPNAFLANPAAFARGTSIEAMQAAAVNIPENAWGPR